MTIDDGVELQQLPEPTSQENVAEPAGVGPGDVVDMDAHHAGVVGRRRRIVGEQTQLLGVALAVVKDGGALPAALLIGVEFAQVSDDLLPRPGLGATNLDQREVAVCPAALGPRVTPEEHAAPPQMAEIRPGTGYGPSFHYIEFPTPICKTQAEFAREKSKTTDFSPEVAEMG